MNQDLLQRLIDEPEAQLRALSAEDLGQDADTQAAVAAWIGIERRLSAELSEALPDRETFVLAALADRGRSDLLTAAEKKRAAAVEFKSLLERHPGLDLAARDIAQDAADLQRRYAALFAPRVDRPAAQPPRTRLAGRWAARVSLAVVVAGFMAAIWIFGGNPGQQQIVTAPSDGTQEVTLTDGSAIRLVDGASLMFASPEARDVTLTGQAFFDVVPGGDFTVRTNASISTVLGTRFAVRSSELATFVTVVDGRVRVAAAFDPALAVELGPGQETRVDPNAAPISPRSVDLTGSLLWTDLLIFRAAPIRDVLVRLQEVYGAQVSAADVLLDEQITGTFEQSRPLREHLDAMASTLGAVVVETSGGALRLEVR